MFYPYRANMYILDLKSGDVNGDGIIDKVCLTGQKTSPGELFADNIAIVIQDGRTNISLKIPLNNAAGYNAQLFLGTFTSKQQMDILVSIDTGGSGGYILAWLYTIRNNQSLLLFNSAGFEESSTYKADFKENFKVDVSSGHGNGKFIIDLSGNRKMYIDAGIYSESGKLLKPAEGGVLGLGALYPLLVNYNGLYQLLAFQRIIGIYNADNLGAVQTYLKWNGNALITDRVEVAIMPI
jgi:hypothetical protein